MCSVPVYLCWAVFLLLGPGVLWAGINPFCKLYRVRVVLTTTSDWTSLQPGPAWKDSFLITQTIVPEASLAEQLKVQDFSIRKRAYDDTEITVEFTTLLALCEEDMVFEVTKGDIGKTVVKIYGSGPAQETLIATFTNDKNIPADPANPARFVVSRDKLACAGVVTPPTDSLAYPRLVLSFYYPWYGSPSGPSGRWVHWDPQNRYASTNTPALGYYDSTDPNIISKHIELARQAGIDAFVASWWGRGSFEDAAFDKLLRTAEQKGFLAAIYYEQAGSPQNIYEDFLYVLDRYAASKAFLKLAGRPVIFVYGRVSLRFEPSDWEYVFGRLATETGTRPFVIADGLSARLLQTFDGVHTYNPVTHSLNQIDAMYQKAGLASLATGRLFAATVAAGYDDRVIRTPGLRVERDKGWYYQNLWRIATKARPGWILITSFNEWHEGSEIEPSIEYGDFYLKLTAKLAGAFRTGEALSF
jgi:hypothetical protein